MLSLRCKRSIVSARKFFFSFFSALHVQTSRYIGGTAFTSMPMKPGTVLKSLGVFKDQDPPVTKSRDEYPEWMGDLAKPMPSLAGLRRMTNDEAHDTDIMRYLKLSRRKRIQQRNEQASV
jgi:hypothetical protein